MSVTQQLDETLNLIMMEFFVGNNWLLLAIIYSRKRVGILNRSP